MKADITLDGFLHIYAETELEGYALNRWADDNVGNINCTDHPKIVLSNDPRVSAPIQVERPKPPENVNY